MGYGEVVVVGGEGKVEGGKRGVGVKEMNEIGIGGKESGLSRVRLEEMKREKGLEVCVESRGLEELVGWGDGKKGLG